MIDKINIYCVTSSRITSSKIRIETIKLPSYRPHSPSSRITSSKIRIETMEAKIIMDTQLASRITSSKIRIETWMGSVEMYGAVLFQSLFYWK